LFPIPSPIPPLPAQVESPGDKSKRIDIQDDSYKQVVIFEHETRRKN